MVYSSKDFESLWFLYQAEGFPKNISIEEFSTKHGDLGLAKRTSSRGFPNFGKWYHKTHKIVYPIAITGRPDEDETIQTEAEKVSEESQVHDQVCHPLKYSTDRVSNINKKISISIIYLDGMRIAKQDISFTELKHLIERLEVVC